MHLIIDAGNSRTKVAIYTGNTLVRQFSTDKTPLAEILLFIKKEKKINAVILADVTGKATALIKYVSRKKQFIRLTKSIPMPFKNNYRTPETLGNDRLANAAGAAMYFPTKNVLIIDVGTCLKFDFVNAKQEYLGGAISPGLHMRYKSLHAFTGKLPLLKPSKKVMLTGNTTATSIISGVQNGMLLEINGVIEQYKKNYTSLKVILTGGDAALFANHLKNSIFVAPNLTLEGLNEILNYNVAHHS